MSTTLTAPPIPKQSPYYPVHVQAGAQPRASRWLWLVKWLLLIPHAIVLVFLWIAFVALSLAAFVGILVSGRYPRALFDFNVGVMRWSWRVSYYGYSALATDRYPPFTLADVPDYPAHLEVDYPQHLSRGLVLVKWWLLALPHYLIVGILVGSGTWWIANDDSPARFAWGGGLVGLLVLVSAVVLGFTGHYPRPLYALVVGLNRWVLRVGAYAALMTDVYPPFRLDLGPDEPEGPIPPVHPQQHVAAAPAAAPDVAPVVAPAAAAAPPSGTPHPKTGWTAGRIVAVVLGSLLGLTSLGVLTGGVSLLVADTALRDGSGYVASAERPLSSPGYAWTMPSLRIDTAPGATLLPQRLLGDVRLRATASGGESVFVGIASSADVERYLGDVARTVPDEAWAGGREVPGLAPAAPPTELPIWDASTVGAGTQELSWTPRRGDWAVVLMNADGSSDVSAQVSVAARLPWLGRVGIAVLLTGLILLVVGVSLVATAARRASRHPAGPANERENPSSAGQAGPNPGTRTPAAPPRSPLSGRMASPAPPLEYQIEVATLHDQPTLVVRGLVDESQFGPFLGRCFDRVSTVARGDGIHVSGPPFARLRPLHDGTFEVEAGFPVSGVILGQGDVKASHLPGGTALRTTHRGSYAQASSAHQALNDYAAAHHMRPAGDAWEVYLDTPDVAAPRTLVVLPVRTAQSL